MNVVGIRGRKVEKYGQIVIVDVVEVIWVDVGSVGFAMVTSHKKMCCV